MKNHYHTASFLVITLVTFLIFSGCGGDTIVEYPKGEATIKVNGKPVVGTVRYKFLATGCVVDAATFASLLPGVELFAYAANDGITIQHGSKISCAGVEKETAFISMRPFTMEPPLEFSDGIYWAPLNFFVHAFSGSVQFSSGDTVMVVTLPTPSEIGDVVPEAKAVAQKLSDQFTVRRGDISLANAIQLFVAGYVPNCNGNNSTFPYLIIQAPPSPRQTSPLMFPIIIQMDNDEGFVLVGRTPPECTYFSYRSYLLNRYFGDENPPVRRKIYASLGDTINNYNLNQYHGYQNPFESLLVIIVTGNKRTQDMLTEAVKAAGIPEDRILYDIIPPELVKFGLDFMADGFHILHRVSVFSSAEEKNDYITQPTLEILRVTPKERLEFIPLATPSLRDRKTDIEEEDIEPLLPQLLNQLRDAIIAEHGGGYPPPTQLDTSVWLEEGRKAIQDRIDVLGETRDTIYLRTPSFVLKENDLIVVYGVNHTKTGKAVYTNVSIYGSEYFNGVGGITNSTYEGTARHYLPDVDPDLADMLYVYHFSRTAGPDTFVIPLNADGSYTGFNNGDSVFMGYRAYVDVLTTVGPDIDEIIRDQALHFTNGAQ
jgi:hypothetical protein